jgi:peptidoglycan/xylan/chitin deacetylase (PgdA/CDA1 family)
VAWHGVALLATLARPALWPWTLGSLIADHLILSTVGLWPRSTLLGPNWIRLPSDAQQRGLVAVTFDDGPDPEVTLRVLAILDEHSVKATFFCIGDRVRQYPALAREIVRRGHDIENHSQRHTHTFSLLGPRGMSQEIERAQETITDVTGREPRFFRAPAGLRSPFLDPVLARVGLQLTSWTRRGYDTVNRSAEGVLAKLTHRLGAGDILLLHDGSAARSADGQPIVLAVLPRLLAAIAAQGLTPVTLAATLT